VLFIDFTKAFDYVVRDNLWYKLIKLGIRGNILYVMKSMYNSIKSKVKYSNTLSDSFECMLGVRQGECLSPFLFSMYLNDLEQEFHMNGLNGIDINCFKMFLLLYADDIIIFANNADELQRGLDLLHEYCNTWKLVVNTDKSKIMIFRKGGRNSNISFRYNNKTIDIVNRFNYLGVVFTSGGSFCDASNTLAGQALKAIFKLKKYLYKFTEIPVGNKLELFDKLITPILNYGSEVWGFFKALPIERVHMQFCKQLLGVKKCTQNDFVYGEVGRINYQSRRYLNIIKYWVKLLRTPDNKFIKKIYLTLLNDSIVYPLKKNWCTLLKDLLSNLGFYDAWLFQDVGNVNIFISALRQRLSDTFIQNWNNRLENSSRANLYKHIAIFRFQPYLNYCQKSKFRISFSKLRLASHRLHIESGRWARPTLIPLEQRKCTVCNQIEDENKLVIKKLCIYIFNAFQVRTDNTYVMSN